MRDFLVGDYGFVSMGLNYALAIVLPITTMFFLVFGVLEDSGYVPRLAIFSDRVFRSMGLNGKAVLPMVLGLGCDTMATMTTRILGTPKERLIAIVLLALGIPCSAQLATILGILGGISFWALVTLFGVVVTQMFLVGFLAARILPGERSDFMLELPPIRLPDPVNLLKKTALRIRWYLGEAVPLFLVGTALLFVLDRTGLLAWVVRASSPVVTGLLGLPAQAAQVFVMGFLRRDYGAAGLFHLAHERPADGSPGGGGADRHDPVRPVRGQRPDDCERTRRQGRDRHPRVHHARGGAHRSRPELWPQAVPCHVLTRPCTGCRR